MTDEELQDIRQMYIVACGSAYHVGMAAQYVIEELTGIPVRVELASEFRYRKMQLIKDSLVIIISQSGETADSLAALRASKDAGIKTLGIVSSYLSRVKIERMLLIHSNKFLIECDQMTGLYNRASYDKDIQSVKPHEYFKLVSMDVNGLKRENDTYGHAAGDEMILSAADCLKKVIAPYGKCYRIGGDEFTAIIKTKTEQNFPKLLHDEADKHICTTGTKLSISVGEADTGDSDSISDIMHLADTRMYDEKKEYYRLSGDKR